MESIRVTPSGEHLGRSKHVGAFHGGPALPCASTYDELDQRPWINRRLQNLSINLRFLKPGVSRKNTMRTSRTPDHFGRFNLNARNWVDSGLSTRFVEGALQPAFRLQSLRLARVPVRFAASTVERGVDLPVCSSLLAMT